MAANSLKIFLKLGTIEGESTVKGHEKEIVILSYEQGVEVATAAGGGGSGGGASGKPRFSGVRLRKDVDKASIPMMLACASGQVQRQAIFSFRRNPGGFVFYKVTLEEVSITKFMQRAGTEAQYLLSVEALNTGPTPGFLDEATLTYARIRWEHRTQRANGSVGITTNGGWDLRNNRPL